MKMLIKSNKGCSNIYAAAPGMLLHINENFTIGKLKSSFLSLFFS
jgi:hypothetical protein